MQYLSHQVHVEKQEKTQSEKQQRSFDKNVRKILLRDCAKLYRI